MGCFFSTPAEETVQGNGQATHFDAPGSKEKPTRNFQRPKWKATEPSFMHSSQLKVKAYGGLAP